jgi:KH domain
MTPSEHSVMKESSVSGGPGSGVPSSRIEWPFSKIGLLSGATGASTLKDIMENTHTDITVDFGGPPGLPRKVVITGAREADVGLANVLLSDIIATGSYVSFKESAGDLPQSSGQGQDSMNSIRDTGSDGIFDQRARASSGSFGPPNHNDPLGYFPGSRGDPNGAFAYPSLLGFNAAQREAEMRERERYPNGNGSPNGPEYRSQFTGGPLPSGELSEREREQRMAAARFGGAPSAESNLAMTAQQQQLQLLQMTSRYPRLFPSASGGTGGPHTGLGPRPSVNGLNPLSMPVSGVAYPGQAPGIGGIGGRHPPPRGPPEPSGRGFEGGAGGFDDDPAFDAMRSESLNRAIERANASTGVILGEMLCPAEKISLIIGTKGSIINEISRKSNTVISIVDDDSRANPANPYGATANKTHRLILIRGSDEGVETAKRYISGVIASGPAYLNVEILSPSSYQNMAINMGMTMVGQEPFRGPGPALLGAPPGPYNRDGVLSQHPSLSRPTSAAGSGRLPDYDDRYNPLAQAQLQGGPPGLADRLEYDREDRLSVPLKSAGPPGLIASAADPALTESPFWGSNGNHSQYGGMDGGRIAPPPQLSFTDLKIAGIMNNTDSGNTAPDPNSRRSMARFQTYLDRTHAQQNQQSSPAVTSTVPPFAPTRGPPALGSERVAGGSAYPRTLTEVLDTLTCPLEKIPLLLGPKGSTLRRIIDISGADIIINHELPPSVPRILEVRGTETQVNSAREMIENILENENPSTSSLSGETLSSPGGKDEDEKLSTQDSHWMSMNAATFRADGKSTDRFDTLDDGHSDSKEKDEYEALYGKFLLEDSSGPPTPSRVPTVFVDNTNYDEDYSVNSDEEHSDCLMLTQRVAINSQHLISVIQTNLGLLDRVANCTGTTVRLISKSSLNQFGCSDSAPNSPMKGTVTKARNSLGSHSLDETELAGGDMQRRVFQSANPALSHVVMVSGLALQEVQSGVLVMRKVLQYLHAQSTHSSTTYKAISSLLIEHVSWAGDTLRDLTKSRTALIKDIGTTSGAGVVLIKKFTSSSVAKDVKTPAPPPALSISFADVLLKREPSLPVPAPAAPPASLVVAVSYHHQVVLIGSRFRLAAARTLLEKVISAPEDGFVSTSTSSASSVVSVSVPNNGMSLVRIPPPPRRALDNDSRSDSENEDSYDSEDEDDSYDSGSGDDSYSGNGMNNGRQWSRMDASDTKSDKRRGDEKERSNRRDDDETSNVVCILDCPNDKAGLVIGYKGSAIRTMSAKTRAKIVVTDAIINGGVSKRSVKILGTRKQVEKVMKFIFLHLLLPKFFYFYC